MRLGAAIALGFALLLVRATVLPMFGLAAIGPDLLLPLVVFYGTTGRFAEGVVVALVLGHLADLMSGGTFGIHTFQYACAFGMGNLAHGRIDLRGVIVPCLMVFAVALASGFTLVVLHGFWGLPLSRPAGGLWLGALWTAAFTVFLLPALRALQRLSRRDDRLILPG